METNGIASDKKVDCILEHRWDILYECLELQSKRLNEHLDVDELRHKNYTEQQQNTMKAIAALTASTQGLVDAWTTVSNVQRFLRWVSYFAIVGVFATWLWYKITAILFLEKFFGE